MNAGWTDHDYESVLRFLNARTGLVFRPDQQTFTRQSIQRTVANGGVSSAAQYVELLGRDGKALDDLVIALTIGETYFFREPRQFDYIQRHVLPELFNRRGSQHTIRFWCAGCASGEEPYSLAMLCEQQGVGRRTRILATDVSSKAIGRAREACYTNWSLRGAGASRAEPFLTKTDDRYLVAPEIRERVEFELLNLALDVYPSYVTRTMGLDMILCRNVLIYFDRTTIGEVARRFFESLAPGGWLITAAGDPMLSSYAEFERDVTKEGVFYRRPLKPIADPVGPSPQFSEDNVLAVSDVEPRVTGAGPSGSSSAAEPKLAAARRALEQGNYDVAVQLTDAVPGNVEACALHVKALANIDAQAAAAKCGDLTIVHPVSAELHYLHAVLLSQLNRDSEAVNAGQRVIFIDRKLAIAHFTIATVLQRSGRLAEARRHFRNARNLCRQRPSQEVVTFSNGETAEHLAEAAECQLASIDAAIGT